jgi:hypothetical protein
MAAEISKAMNSPELKATLSAQGAYSIASTPEQYASFFADSARLYTNLQQPKCFTINTCCSSVGYIRYLYARNILQLKKW